MFEPFSLPYFQRGLVEVLVLCVGAGLVGTQIVLRNLAFFTHAVGTATFPGLVAAKALGVAGALGAGLTGALVAGGVGLAAGRKGERHDAITALALVGALAVGVILASDLFPASGNVEGLLFGSLLLVTWADVALAAATSLCAVVLTRLLEARWVLAGFDPAAARSLGVRTSAPDAALLALVALMALSALTTLGALLATALLVVPAATTRLVCTRLRSWQVATIALGAAEGVGGLWLAWACNASPGAAQAVLSGSIFAGTALVTACPRPAVAAPS